MNRKALEMLALFGAFGGMSGMASGRTFEPKEPRRRHIFDDLRTARQAASAKNITVLCVNSDGEKFKVYPDGSIRGCKYNTKPPAGYYAKEPKAA
jgi:hypothetical protein